MIIADQITLFFTRLGEDEANSRVTPAQALARINSSRQIVAGKTRFYDVKDSTVDDDGVSTVVGGETEFTLADTFLGLQDARDSVTRNGYPVTMKSLAEWATIINETIPSGNESWGMLHGNTFYVWPAAVAGDIFVWWGAAEPPALAAVTGPDVYLNNQQASATVLDAVISAREDFKEPVGPKLVADYKDLEKQITKKGRAAGPRLESAPGV